MDQERIVFAKGDDRRTMFTDHLPENGIVDSMEIVTIVLVIVILIEIVLVETGQFVTSEVSRQLFGVDDSCNERRGNVEVEGERRRWIRTDDRPRLVC